MPGDKTPDVAMPKVTFQFPGSCWNSTICVVHFSTVSWPIWTVDSPRVPWATLCSHQPRVHPALTQLLGSEILPDTSFPPWKAPLPDPPLTSLKTRAASSWILQLWWQCPGQVTPTVGSHKHWAASCLGSCACRETPDKQGMLFLSAETNSDKKLQGWDTPAAQPAKCSTATDPAARYDPNAQPAQHWGS